MDIIGVITEYNPFHNGHIYHINKIKELYPNSIIILALNGYFLERGEISIMTKEEKTKMALNYGINLVVEIPFIYGSNSADTFKPCLSIHFAIIVPKFFFITGKLISRSKQWSGSVLSTKPKS